MRRWLLALLLVGVAQAAQAAEVRVLTAGAFKPVLDALIPAYSTRTGDQVTVETDTAGGIARRIERGDPFDLAVLTPATADAPSKDGKLIVVTPIASVGVAVAVKAGAPKPDISTVDKFKAALLAAPSVAMVDPASGGTSGAFLAKLFDQLGIAAQMQPKLQLTQGGLAAERVVSGQAAMAIAQASEVLAVPGAALVGPIPATLQNRTVYVAGLNPKAGQAALVLLAALAGPEGQGLLAGKGMGPP